MENKKCSICELDFWSKNFCRYHYDSEYRKNNREKIRLQNKILRNKNKEKINEQRRIKYQKNREVIIQRVKNYYKLNKESVIKRQVIYEQKRKKIDPIFKLKINLRGRLNKAIKHNYKNGSAVNDLGCSVEFFKTYLESKFTEGMSWETYGKGKGKWNIDHILPLDMFDLTNREDILKVCHYTNLHPMWSEENISKGCKV